MERTTWESVLPVVGYLPAPGERLYRQPSNDATFTRQFLDTWQIMSEVEAEMNGQGSSGDGNGAGVEDIERSLGGLSQSHGEHH